MTNTETTQVPRIYDPADDKGKFTDANPGVTLQQIGAGNIMAISGGRWTCTALGGVILPVGRGYAVTVDLAGNDTYTVRRTFTRRPRRAPGQLVPSEPVTKIFGELADVHCEELGEQAYQASCFVNVRFGGHDPFAS